ncbi:MAG: hypothetical protein AAF943_11690 [Pseudomonadota bacterium]
MTNKIALILGVCLISALAWDLSFNEAQGVLFLTRAFLDLIEWLAFWR